MWKQDYGSTPPRQRGGASEHHFETSGFYRIERQTGKSVSLINFAFKTGTMRAFPMPGFEAMEFKPEYGITLYGRDFDIRIEGCYLKTLYRYLTQRRVLEIRDYRDAEEVNPCFIESILIRYREGESDRIWID